jgi:hypothetical protein
VDLVSIVLKNSVAEISFGDQVRQSSPSGTDPIRRSALGPKTQYIDFFLEVCGDNDAIEGAPCVGVKLRLIVTRDAPIL